MTSQATDHMSSSDRDDSSKQMTPRPVTHPSLLTLTHADYSQSYSENRAGAGGSAADTGSDRQLWLDWERNPAN